MQVQDARKRIGTELAQEPERGIPRSWAAVLIRTGPGHFENFSRVRDSALPPVTGAG